MIEGEDCQSVYGWQFFQACFFFILCFSVTKPVFLTLIDRRWAGAGF